MEYGTEHRAQSTTRSTRQIRIIASLPLSLSLSFGRIKRTDLRSTQPSVTGNPKVLSPAPVLLCTLRFAPFLSSIALAHDLRHYDNHNNTAVTAAVVYGAGGVDMSVVMILPCSRASLITVEPPFLRMSNRPSLLALGFWLLTSAFHSEA